MSNIDFVELATFCANRAKEARSSWGGKYERTHYVSILEDNTVKYSMTPHVLRNAHECILMHERSEIPISNLYYWYEFEYINPEGCVFASDLENDFDLISYKSKHSAPFIELRYKENFLYSNLNIQKVWELYSKIKDIPTETERKLVVDLFEKDEKIFELEEQIKDFSFANQLLKQERDQYKELLDEIKDRFK
jgi:cellobiose phosphorylase